jgi:hypothetical protein
MPEMTTSFKLEGIAVTTGARDQMEDVEGYSYPEI